MPLNRSHSSQRNAPSARAYRIGLAAILLVSLALNAVPLWWGLPSDGNSTWAFDEIPPSDGGQKVESRHRGRYPPLHYHVLRGVYFPVRALVARGVLTLAADELRTVLQILGRALSVVLATATIYLIYRIGRLVSGRGPALLAALSAALAVPFVFYAKTINLEAAYVFWFVLSVFFFVRAQQHHRLRDYLALAAAAAFAVCTKDQAYALYVLAPLVLLLDLRRHRSSTGASRDSLLWTLADRRLVWSTLLSAALFALIHNLLFDWQGFLKHLHIITTWSAPWRMYEPTIEGQARMLGQAVRHMAFSLGWPLLVAAVAGIVIAVRERSRLLLSLLVFPVSYYLFFVVPILYHYDRFFIPVCAVLALFAGRGLWALIGWGGRRAMWGQAVLSVVVLFTVLRPLSLVQEMLFDSRYGVEAWLDEREATASVAVIGTLRQRLPRGRGVRKLAYAADRGVSYLRDLDADILVVNEEEPTTRKQRRFVDGLVTGDLNYAVLFRRRYQPWPFRLERKGISTNLLTVNPQITVLERRQPWGLSDEEVFERLIALRDGSEEVGWSGLADAIADAPPSGQKRGLGTDTVTFGLSPDGWTRGKLPAAVVVENFEDRPLVPTLRLSCSASEEVLPLTAFVASEEGIDRVPFDTAGHRVVELAVVPPGGRRMVVVYADRGWTPSEEDRRRLGVNVRRGPNRQPEELR